MAKVKRFVGIDVSKAQLDVTLGADGGTSWFLTMNMGSASPEAPYARSRTGDPRSNRWSGSAGGGRAGGGGNRGCGGQSQTGREFARATGRLAKTDRLDAQVLARFGEAVKPPVRPLKNEQAQALEALVMRRSQLVGMLTAEKNRRANSPKVIHRSIDEHIRWLEKRLSGFDGELSDLIRATPIWRERDELLRSVPEVGTVLSVTLLTHLPELGTLTRKPGAAPAGLASFNRDSGTTRQQLHLRWPRPTRTRAIHGHGCLANPTFAAFISTFSAVLARVSRHGCC